MDSYEGVPTTNDMCVCVCVRHSYRDEELLGSAAGAAVEEFSRDSADNAVSGSTRHFFRGHHVIIVDLGVSNQ